MCLWLWRPDAALLESMLLEVRDPHHPEHMAPDRRENHLGDFTFLHFHIQPLQVVAWTPFVGGGPIRFHLCG